jgi:hypothetical protein
MLFIISFMLFIILFHLYAITDPLQQLALAFGPSAYLFIDLPRIELSCSYFFVYFLRIYLSIYLLIDWSIELLIDILYAWLAVQTRHNKMQHTNTRVGNAGATHPRDPLLSPITHRNAPRSPRGE